MRQLVDSQRQQLDDGARRIDELRARSALLLIGWIVLTLGLSALIGWVVTGSITRPPRQAESMARSIADMDLSGRPQARYGSDETGRLPRALDAMRLALQKALQEVRGVADGISTASTLNVAVSQLDQMTQQNAALVEASSAATESLREQAQRLADVVSVFRLA